MNRVAKRARGWAPQWRRRWILLAALIALAQFGAFWVLSPSSAWGPGRPPTPRYAFVNAESYGSRFDTWLWLMTPGVFLVPSMHGFSGPGWLEKPPVEVTFEPLTVEGRPLPYMPVGTITASPPLLSRVDPGPASRWEIPGDEPALPHAGPVPLLNRTTLRVLGGLSGWRLPADVAIPSPPGEALLRSTVVRIVVDGRGNIITPPSVWESSGVPAADELAARWVAGLRLEGETSRDLNAWDRSATSGLLSIEWGTGVPSIASTNQTGSGHAP